MLLDTTPPLVTLIGDSLITRPYGEAYTDAGAEAIDDVDGALEVGVTGSVDPEVEGLYVIAYSATDAAGNVSEPLHRIVVVELVYDTTTPCDAGNANIELEVGGVFVDPGGLRAMISMKLSTF